VGGFLTSAAQVRRLPARRSGNAGPCALVEEAPEDGPGLVLLNLLQVRG
jgi:hypothetical protein